MKETVPWSNITWSEMGKQNVQAKEVHLGGLNRIRTQDLCDAGGMFYRLSYEATECRSFRLQVVSPTSRFAYTEVDLPEVGESTLSV